MTWAHTVLPVCGSSGALFWAPSSRSAPAHVQSGRVLPVSGEPRRCVPPRARPPLGSHAASHRPPFCTSWCSHTTLWVFSCRCHGASLCPAASPPRPGDLSSCRAVSGCPLLGKSFGSPSLPHSLHLSAAVLMPFPNPSRLHGSCSHGRRRGSELRTWWSLNRHFLKKSRKGSFGVGRKPLV